MIVSEKPLTPTQIAKQIPGSRGAKHTDPATIVRWILKGCQDMNGNYVRLKAIRAGNRWLIYQRDLEAFFAKLGTDPAETPTATPNDAPNAAAERAGKVLEACGA